MAYLDENGKIIPQLSLEKMEGILKEASAKMLDEVDKENLKNFKGTPMKLEFAKTEIHRYFDLGVDKSDVAYLVASWGLSTDDLEKANNYLHTIFKKQCKSSLQEGIIL
ncbi:MAG: hypothetical protein WC389_19815 [Lutibacter sp.]|jgi:uncharacterized lipoprotein YehR (DUF1307 family)